MNTQVNVFPSSIKIVWIIEQSKLDHNSESSVAMKSLWEWFLVFNSQNSNINTSRVKHCLNYNNLKVIITPINRSQYTYLPRHNSFSHRKPITTQFFSLLLGWLAGSILKRVQVRIGTYYPSTFICSAWEIKKIASRELDVMASLERG